MLHCTMKIAKKVERFYASAQADHWCAVGKFAPRRSVGGESGRFAALHWAPGIEWITKGPRAPLELIG